MAKEEATDAGALNDLDEALELLIQRSGLSYTEVGARIGLSPGAVRNYLHKPLPRSIRTLGRIISESLGLSVVDLMEALVTVKRRRDEPDPLTEEELRKATKFFLLSLQLPPDESLHSEPSEDSDG